MANYIVRTMKGKYRVLWMYNEVWVTMITPRTKRILIILNPEKQDYLFLFFGTAFS